MRRRRRVRSRSKGVSAIIVLVAVGLGLLFTWQGQRIGRQEERASKVGTAKLNMPLRFLVPFDVQHAGEIVASRASLFKESGLVVDVQPAHAGYDPIAAVVKGEDVFGVVDGATFLVARARGEPIVAFGAGYLESPVVFYALERSGIRTPHDFIGKRVLRQAGGDAAIVYDALLQNVGLSRSQMREMAGEQGVDALVNGDIDVLPGLVTKQSYELRSRGVGYNVIRPADYGIHVPGTVYFASEKFVATYPSIVQRFLNAVIAGWRTTYADNAANVPLMLAASGSSISADQVRFELAAQRDFVLPPARRIGEFDDRQWKQLRIVLLIARMIDEGADLSGAINLGFLKEAYRRPISAGN